MSKGKPKAYHVCSEHFSDEDYVQADLLRVRMMGCSKNQKIHLKKDAQPNTERVGLSKCMATLISEKKPLFHRGVLVRIVLR